MSFSCRRSEYGFMLMEVMIAISMIAIAMTVALGLQSRSISMASEAKFTTTASLLAQKKIAEIEATPLEKVISESGDFGEDFPEYQWNVEINDTDIFQQEEVARRLKTIDLDISWGGDDAFLYSIRLYRFLRENRNP